MTARRNRRAGVEDLWRKSDGSPSKLNGTGLRWRARYVDDENREHTRRFRTKPEAARYLEEITTSQVTGTYVAPKAGLATVEVIHGQWSAAQGHIKATTAATRAVTWKTHVRDRWGAVAVAQVQTSAVRAWVAELVNHGANPATVENALGVLRMTLDLAVEDRRLPRNPCTGVKAPRRQHRQRGYLTHQQVEDLAQAVRSNPEVIRFLAYTGLRWGEMAALKVENIDMLRRRVNVMQGVAEVKGTLVWSTAKNHERRSVPFPAFLTEQLAALMVGKARGDLVFTSPESHVLRVSSYRPRVFNDAVKACQGQSEDFPKVTPHDLRHTAASLAISAGANVKGVQLMLGHKSAALTLDTYADLFPDDLEAVAEALNAAALAAAAYSLRTEEQ
jgi:integrase